VVSVRVAMYDAQGVELSSPAETRYVHGGYGGLLEGLERALEVASTSLPTSLTARWCWTATIRWLAWRCASRSTCWL
jgi:hypothetical protein